MGICLANSRGKVGSRNCRFHNVNVGAELKNGIPYAFITVTKYFSSGISTRVN